MDLAVLLGGVLAALCVVWVARPFLREPSLAAGADVLDGLDEAGQRRELLVEQRDRALAALKELEFDHRAGKVSDDDYRRAVSPLRAEAAQALAALDAITD